MMFDLKYSQEESDMKKLMAAVLKQAIDDYIKLQHHKYRKKKYMEEAFLYSVELFFNPKYKFLYFENDDKTNMSTKNFISKILNKPSVDVTILQKYIIQKSIEYWDNKYMKVFNIPSYFIYKGITYNIIMSEKDTFSINFIKKEIIFNKRSDNPELIFIKAITTLIDNENNLNLTDKQLGDLSKSLYEILKINNLYLD